MVYPGAQRAFDFRRNMRTVGDDLARADALNRTVRFLNQVLGAKGQEGELERADQGGEEMEGGSVSRRVALRALGLLGVSAAAAPFLVGAPGPALGQGNLATLQPEEKVDATLKRLFGGRPIKDGSSLIKLELPLIAENGAVVPITVEVQSPMTPASYVKHIYLISDRNRRPMNAKFTLTPEMGAASLGANLRLNETGDVRAIVELNDGSLLMAKREVKVTVGGCGG